MKAVFPRCLETKAFVNALLYSIVQATNKGQSSVEGLKLKGNALQSLHHSLTSEGRTLHHSDVGAVIILQGVAVSHVW